MSAPFDAAPAETVGHHSADDSAAIALSYDRPERFGVIFDRYFTEIHGYVARRLGADAAEDVAAETFLTAFRQRDRYDPSRGNVRAWLYGIASNLLRRHLRQEVRSYRALARVSVAAASDSHEDQVAAQTSAGVLDGRLAAAVARLSPGDRDVLLLVALGGLSYGEVAAALQLRHGTVCSRLNRARRQIRQTLGCIKPSGDDPIDSSHDSPRHDREANHG